MNTLQNIVNILLLIAAVLLVPAADALPKTIDWSKARKVQRGVLMVKMNLDRPRLLKVAVMRVDLHTPGLTLTTTARDARWGKEMPDRPGILIGTKRITTAQFLLDARKSNGRNPGVNMIAAFNAVSSTTSPREVLKKNGLRLRPRKNPSSARCSVRHGPYSAPCSGT